MNRQLSLKVGALLLVTAALALSNVAQQPSQDATGRECTVPTYNGKDLDLKPRILAKPDPRFSSDERRRYAGQVMTLEAILCGTGNVTDVKVKEGLTDGLNEKAIEAARLIKFSPAEKDGNKVSRFVVLKYIVYILR